MSEIVRLEAELRSALVAPDESVMDAADAPVDGDTAEPPVVSRLMSVGQSGGATPSTKTDEPAAPVYGWFSIIGTPGRLRVGVTDGERVWWLGEGERVPGGPVIERIVARPPGVHVGGGDVLPHDARPAGDRP